MGLSDSYKSHREYLMNNTNDTNILFLAIHGFYLYLRKKKSYNINIPKGA